jgi:hypothetical protein
MPLRLSFGHGSTGTKPTYPNVALASPDITDSAPAAAKVDSLSVDTAVSLGFIPKVEGTMCWPSFKKKALDVISILDKDD